MQGSAPPPFIGAKNALQIISLAAYASETKKQRGATYFNRYLS